MTIITHPAQARNKNAGIQIAGNLGAIGRNVFSLPEYLSQQLTNMTNDT
ncbi:hypothetical protein [Microcoleus sp.]